MAEGSSSSNDVNHILRRIELLVVPKILTAIGGRTVVEETVVEARSKR